MLPLLPQGFYPALGTSYNILQETLCQTLLLPVLSSGRCCASLCVEQLLKKQHQHYSDFFVLLKDSYELIKI